MYACMHVRIYIRMKPLRGSAGSANLTVRFWKPFTVFRVYAARQPYLKTQVSGSATKLRSRECTHHHLYGFGFASQPINLDLGF